MRAAIYFTPPPEAPLTQAAASWLGRDALSNAPTRAPEPAIDPIVAEPARYGFHATMRSPFRLREGASLADLEQVLTVFAATRRAVLMPRIRLARLGRFFALVPADAPAELSELEAAVLAAFEPLRAPLTDAERARRRPDTLTDRQRSNLDRWGYPYVGEEFRFHMTLTGPVDASYADRVETMLRERFGAFEGGPLAIDRLALFVEETPGAPFEARTPVPFGG